MWTIFKEKNKTIPSDEIDMKEDIVVREKKSFHILLFNIMMKHYM